MRRMYIAPVTTWLAATHAGLFHPVAGSHYIDLHLNPLPHGDLHALFIERGFDLGRASSALAAFRSDDGSTSNLILINTDFHSEAAEETWQSHSQVAVLPHPTFEGNDVITKHIGCEIKKIRENHIKSLAAHPLLGFEAEVDTVWHLSKKAASIHPLMRLRHTL